MLSIQSTPVVGNSFTNTYDNWKEGTYENFKEWAVRQFGIEELESDDEAEVPVLNQKAKNISFQKSKRGYLVLPSINDFTKVRQRQRVVRGYIGSVYRKTICFFSLFFSKFITGEFTGNSKAPFPYTLASKEDQDIYSTDSAPEGFQLINPDHLPSANINSLYNHWLKRQKKGLCPFIVLKAGPHHVAMEKKSEKSKGKAKMDYLDVSDDSDEEEEEDEGKEDKHEEEEEEEDVEPPKFGPPGRKVNKFPPTAHLEASTSHLPGPSKSTALKTTSKPNGRHQVPKGGRVVPEKSEPDDDVAGRDRSSLGKVDSEMRSGEDEMLVDTPPQKTKKAKNIKHSTEKGNPKKRPAEDELESDVPAKVQKTGVRKSVRVASKSVGENPKKVSVFFVS
jgi:hypothetical protein